MRTKTRIKTKIKNHIYHFDYDKYWKMRDEILAAKLDIKPAPNIYIYIYQGFKQIRRLRYLYLIRKMEAFNNASIGLALDGRGTSFAEPPTLGHGLYGIVIHEDAVIGKNCTIFQRVTIGGRYNGAPHIGDNCYIGANATIVGGITIGNNVKIGAGCVVATDIPDGATVVMDKPRIIIKN